MFGGDDAVSETDVCDDVVMVCDTEIGCDVMAVSGKDATRSCHVNSRLGKERRGNE